MLDQVSLFYHHPWLLQKIVQDYATISTGLKWRLVHEFAANPVVEGRWDAIRTLLADLPTDTPTNTWPLQPSHAEAVAQLGQLPEGEDRIRAMGHIVRTRYDDAPFVSADDLLAALQFGEPSAFIGTYLTTLPTQLHRLELHWERDALALRGTTVDAMREHAVAQLLVTEEHARAHCPALLDNPSRNARLLFLGAYAAARAPAHAQRHWHWMLQHQPRLPPLCIDRGLAAARDPAALATVWNDVRAAVQVADVEDLLELHYARVGGAGPAHEFLDYTPVAEPRAHWAFARGVPPDEWAFKMRTRFGLLSRSGMDMDGAVFMLGPFSPYYRMVRAVDDDQKRRAPRHPRHTAQPGV